MVERFEDIYSVGSDVYIFDLYCILNDVKEIINVTQFQVEKEVDSNNWSDSLVINAREVATISVSNIEITQTT